jgi:hypothetical protein
MRAGMRQTFGRIQALLGEASAILIFQLDLVEQPAIAAQTTRQAQLACRIDLSFLSGRGRIAQKSPSRT